MDEIGIASDVKAAAPTSAADVEAPARASRGARVFALLVLAAAIAGGAYWIWGRSDGDSSAAARTPQAARAASVVTAVAKVGDLPVYLDGLGTVTALNTVVLRSRVDGQLEKVAFTEGQSVHVGDLIAEIDSRAFAVQLAQAEGQFAKDNALLENAKLDLQRYQAAHEAVPQQQIATAEANVALYRGAVQVDQSQIDNAKLSMTYCRIVAPIDGKLGLRLVDVGNMVHANDATGLAVITEVQPIAVQFSLPQDSLPAVLVAQSAGTLPAEAWDRDLRHRLALGELLAIDNQIDSSTGTIRLKAKFANQDGTLFPNQFVNVRLLVDTKRNAVLVPSAAILRSPQSNFVYVVDGDAVRAHDVVVGPTEGDSVVIEKGLAANDMVVVDGADKLTDGAKVALRKPDDERASNATTGGAKDASDKSAAKPAPDDKGAADSKGQARSKRRGG